MPQQEVPRIALWEQFFDDESLRRGGWDADASVRPPEARALEVVRELTHASGLGPLLEFASRHLQARRLEGCWPNAQVIQIPVRF